MPGKAPCDGFPRSPRPPVPVTNWSGDGGWRSNDGRPFVEPIKPEPPSPGGAEYVELHCHSQYSMRDSAAHVEDLVSRAKVLQMKALAMTDHNSMSVAPEFRSLALSPDPSQIKPIQGVEVSFQGHEGGDFHLTLLTENETGFAHLCEILTLARPPERRHDPLATIDMLDGRTESVICLTGCAKGELSYHLLRKDEARASETLGRWRDLFGPQNVYVEMQDHALGFEAGLNHRRCEMAARFGLPVVATNNVHLLAREHFWVHEAMACWKAGRVSRSTVFPDRPRSAEVYLKSANEMAALFSERPDAVRNTLEIAERCSPVLDPAVRRWPGIVIPDGHTEESYLRFMVNEGAKIRCKDPSSSEVVERIEYELQLIGVKGFPGYFLLVCDICRWMREVDILYRIRGSGGGSLVAYCLGISTLDPLHYKLSFDRFLNAARNAPPDIDIDIDSRERDRVVAHLREQYGRDHVASVAAFSTIRGKSLIRDFGPVFDIPQPMVAVAAKSLRNVAANNLDGAFERLPQLRDSGVPREPFEPIIDLGKIINRFPSHSQTMVGVVVSGPPLTEVSPLWPAAKDNEWAVAYDKEWVEKTGLIKTDFLFLRELSAIRDCLAFLKKQGRPLDYDNIPLDDPDTYELLSSGRTIGVFQLESPAQRVLMQRLKPRDISDCIAAVALIRPGPISGDAVNPFVRRRTGREPVTYPHERLRSILEETLGVVIYQDQVLEIATIAANWSPDRADDLRRKISHARRKKQMDDTQKEFVTAVVANGFTAEIAGWCFQSIMGFASYGFCHAHSTAFGETAYKSAYLLAHHTSEYLAGVMNNFPMAYYPLSTVVAEARRRGVRVLGPDVNLSTADDQANHTTIRAGLKHCQGLKKRTLDAIKEAKRAGPFRSVHDFCSRVPASRDEVESLALIGAFDRLHPNRKEILRGAARLTVEGSERRRGGVMLIEPHALPKARDFTPYEKSMRELATQGFCVTEDPMTFHRDKLAAMGVVTCQNALSVRSGGRVSVAGWRIRAHTPPIKSGKTIVFFTLEDETEVVDITVFPDVYDIYGQVIFAESMVVVSGRMQDRDGADCLIAESVRPLRSVLREAREMERALPPLAGVSFEEAGWELAAG